jgi:hypothetical protein
VFNADGLPRGGKKDRPGSKDNTTARKRTPATGALRAVSALPGELLRPGAWAASGLDPAFRAVYSRSGCGWAGPTEAVSALV